MTTATAAAKPRLDGRVCLVTGATSGIGQVTARALAERGGTVVLVGRNPAKTAATVDEIRRRSGGAAVEGLVADLSAQAEVRRLAQMVLERWPRLHVLVNNAGAVFAKRQESFDGIEMTWALNHMSYFLLTTLLLDALRAAAEPGRSARVVNVSSNAHLRAGRLSFDDLESRRGYFSYRAYGLSKLANVLFTYELARRLKAEGAGVTANALHPGLVHTGFGGNNRQAVWRLAYFFINHIALTPEQGAQTSLYLASAPDVEGVSGQYFVRCRPARSSRASYDEAAARRLWTVSEQMAARRTG